MKCIYNQEDIEKFLEGVLSIQDADKIEKHIKLCKKCSSLYETLQHFSKFTSNNYATKCNINEKILSRIDKDRYLNNKHIFSHIIFRIAPVLILISVVTAIIFIVYMFFNIQNINILNDKDNKIGLDSNQVSTLPTSTIKAMEYIDNTYEYTIDILDTPQIKLDIEPKIANENPIQATIDFINFKSSKGELDINGKIENEDLEIVKNEGEEIVIKVKDGKVQIDKIYLRQLIGKDNIIMWFIVGYDPIWIGTIRTFYVQGHIDFFDNNQNTVTIEVINNIHKGVIGQAICQ